MSSLNKNICDIIKFPEASREITLPRALNSYLPLKELGVDLAGVSELTDGFEIARKNPKTHIVMITVGGRGFFRSGNDEYILEKDSVFISPAGVAQHYFTKREHWVNLWLHLEDCDYWGYLKSEGTRLRKAVCGKSLENAMKEFASEAISNMPEANMLARMYADIICVYLRRELKHSSLPGNVYMLSRLAKLWDGVHENLKRKWTLDDLAKSVFLSPAHFSRVCKEYYQLSPLKMVTKLRMQRAEELLKSSAWNLNVIAENVGYDNAFAFSTSFKRFYGVSPSEIRKKSI